MRIIAILLCLFLPAPAQALNVTLGPGHFAEVMEFYYRSPKPELLEPMLAALARGGILANAEKRMLIAAFFGELARAKALDLAPLARKTQELGRDARLTMAWSQHLSGGSATGQKSGDLLRPEDSLAANQIKNSPARLENWDPAWEKSVLGMYWGAFMATGADRWLDAIIAAACKGAHNVGQNNPAASLYEYAPRHPRVAARLKAKLERADPEEKRMLTTILEHANDCQGISYDFYDYRRDDCSNL